MDTYIFSQLTEETLETLVTFKEKYTPPTEWENMQVVLTAEESRRLDDIKSTLYRRHLVAMNEATVWARAIYPMLMLAEQEHVQAWSGVPLKAAYLRLPWRVRQMVPLRLLSAEECNALI